MLSEDMPHRQEIAFNPPISQRIPCLFVSKGILRVDGHTLLLETTEECIEIPPGKFAGVFIEPGTSVTHEAIKLAAETGVQIAWVGEEGTRIYAVNTLHGKPERILRQAQIIGSAKDRIEAARRLYHLMFNEPAPPSYSIEKLRGIEGAKVKKIYEEIAMQLELPWDGRQSNCALNQSISFCTSCLYAITEIAVTTLGYSPCLGVVHSGKDNSFVFDIADTVKFNNFLPDVLAGMRERIAINEVSFQEARIACRNYFIKSKIIDRLMDNTQYIIG